MSCLCAELLNSAPLLLPGRHVLNSALMLGNVGAMGAYMMSNDATLGMSMLGATTTLSAVMGVTLTVAIGGLSKLVLNSQSRFVFSWFATCFFNILCFGLLRRFHANFGQLCLNTMVSFLSAFWSALFFVSF